MLFHWNDFGLGELDRRVLELDALRREMDRVFNDFDRAPPTARSARTSWPRIELADDGSALVLRAELPGLTDKDLKIQIDANTLVLQGGRNLAAPEGHDVHRRERSAYEFTRSFTLPVKVDADRAQASLKNGVLMLRLPKSPELQPRQIKVATN